jgi:hypothetical protein
MKKILGAALGTCVHVGGLHHFLNLAIPEGFQTLSLGPAVSVRRLIQAIENEKPDLVAVSYRLTPEVAIILFNELKTALESHKLQHLRLVFGGTPPVAEVARKTGMFEKVFDGSESLKETRMYLHGGSDKLRHEYFADTLLERIKQKYPYPLVRHHFGRPSLEDTIEGVKTIAEAGVVDVISLGPDQNAQEHFFHPEDMDHVQNGAGGVPVREPGDLMRIYKQSRCGNHPLIRCYSGTTELQRWAEMSLETIHNAWAAIPLCWYSVMDGRSKRSLENAIRENQEVMRFYADRNVPVEVNESHQWSLRDAHDSLAVTMAFLAAYNAKKMGVNHYIAQFMFNNPPGTTPEMDIAKMLAKKALIEELEDEAFTMYREVRAGIAHFSPVAAIAQGQLAASAVISLTLHPHIYHVVGYSEGDHAVYPDELIQSCNIVHGVLQNCLHGLPDMSGDKKVVRRKQELIEEARILLNAIKTFGQDKSEDPWSDPVVIAAAIRIGLLDTPHFQGNQHLCGKIYTRIIDGAWFAIDQETGNPIYEVKRTSGILERYRQEGLSSKV